MSNLFERSILMAIGAAAITREMAESLTEQFVQRGQSTTEEGRQAVGELVDRAKDETRQVKGRLDHSLSRTFRDMGLATHDQVEDMELKLAQIEHRLSLLETVQERLVAERDAAEQEITGKNGRRAKG
jgi:polyhydroxyalkanoate synthesis regulator phasin